MTPGPVEETSEPEIIRRRYLQAGDTISGTTTANQPFQMGPNIPLPQGTFARFATLMNASGGTLYFGRGRQLGTYALAVGQGYTFDYVDVANIIVKDNGTPCSFTIDFCGP